MIRKLNSAALKTSILAGAFLGAGFLAAAPAKAGLLLSLSEPGFTTATTNGTIAGGFDTAAFTSFSFGDFIVTVTVGSSNAPAGSGTSAQLNIQSLDIVRNPASTLTGTAELQIGLSDDTFTFPGSAGSSVNLFSSLGGTLTNYQQGDTVSFASTASDPSDSAVLATAGPSTFTAPDPSANPGPATISLAPVGSGAFLHPNPYTVSSLVTLDFTNANESFNISGTSSVIATTNNVPEPASMALILGSGASLLFRRRRATAA